MGKKYIASILIPALLINLCGCYSMKEISQDKIAGLKPEGDLIVYTKDSKIYFFEEYDYHFSNDSLYVKGNTKYNKNSDFKELFEGAIALTNIEKFEHDELNPASTTLLIVGGILFVAAVGLFLVVISALSDI